MNGRMLWLQHLPSLDKQLKAIAQILNLTNKIAARNLYYGRYNRNNFRDNFQYCRIIGNNRRENFQYCRNNGDNRRGNLQYCRKIGNNVAETNNTTAILLITAAAFDNNAVDR